MSLDVPVNIIGNYGTGATLPAIPIIPKLGKITKLTTKGFTVMLDETGEIFELEKE
jgi:hypothetical protein